MENENIICDQCGTENEPQYIFCKNCGARLLKEQPQDSAFSGGYTPVEPALNGNANFDYQSAPQYNTQNADNQNTYNFSFDGVSVDEMADFVGKKAFKILPHFRKMQLSNSRVTWCWPVAVLSFIFGPIGAAIWFFYRKMYKIGLLLLTIGIILTGFNVVANSEDFKLNDDVNIVYHFNLSDAFADQNGDINILGVVADRVNEIASLACCLVTGLFAYSFYMKHAIKKINEYRMRDTDPHFYRIGLAACGGTSGGMAFLAVVIAMMALTVIVASIQTVIKL